MVDVGALRGRARRPSLIMRIAGALPRTAIRRVTAAVGWRTCSIVDQGWPSPTCRGYRMTLEPVRVGVSLFRPVISLDVSAQITIAVLSFQLAKSGADGSYCSGRPDTRSELFSAISVLSSNVARPLNAAMPPSARRRPPQLPDKHVLPASRERILPVDTAAVVQLRLAVPCSDLRLPRAGCQASVAGTKLGA